MEITKIYERRYHVILTSMEAHAIAGLTGHSNPVLAELAAWLERMVDRQ